MSDAMKICMKYTRRINENQKKNSQLRLFSPPIPELHITQILNFAVMSNICMKKYITLLVYIYLGKWKTNYTDSTYNLIFL